MFVPHQYREPNDSWMVDLIRGNPLALLASNSAPHGEPLATHLPVIWDPRSTGERAADLSGALLLGHMNVRNPHWGALRTGDPILLVFTGPHAYVSPTIYEKSPAAPTWNFTSVHVHGFAEKMTCPEETLNVVQSTVRAFEAEFGTGWNMSDSVGYFRKIISGVGAFRVTVSRAEGMFKLSQEQKPETRDRVRQSFAQRDSSLHRETAHLMGQLPVAGCLADRTSPER